MSKASPVLLILDGHTTHTKSLATIDYARENGIVILSLPPHTSHKLQPLNRSFFKPLKAAYNSAIPEMQKSKRSEESQVVTSSLYKQSLIDNINEQKNRPLKAKKKQLVKKVRRRKLLRLRQLLQETWTIHNALCGMDFGRNYYQERNGCCAQYARNGCMKNVAPL